MMQLAPVEYAKKIRQAPPIVELIIRLADKILGNMLRIIHLLVDSIVPLWYELPLNFLVLQVDKSLKPAKTTTLGVHIPLVSVIPKLYSHWLVELEGGYDASRELAKTTDTSRRRSRLRWLTSGYGRH
jgi:hypothetical protein